jgi:hypothetical protein
MTALIPDATQGLAHGAFQRLPVDADEGFPQAFLLLVDGTTYRITLYVNAPEEDLPEPGAVGATVLDLGARGPQRAFMVVAVARQDPSGETPLLRTRIVPGLEYRAGDIVLTFRTLRVAVRNLNAAGAFGSDVVGGVAVR